MKRPEIVNIGAVEVPLAEVLALPNGVRVLSVGGYNEEVVRFSFVFRAGSACQTVPFSASATANLLSEGTLHHSAQEIAEKLDFLGSNYEVSLDRDWAILNFVTLSKHFDETLSLAREMILQPAFDDNEVRIYREKRKQRLGLERSRVAMRARELFGAALFGDAHPYGVFHDAALYDTLTREDIVAFWRAHYVAERCFVVCSGRVGEHEIEALGEVAGEINGQLGEEAISNYPLSIINYQLNFTPHPDAVQSAIRMGIRLFPRTHPDFAGMQVLTTVLGGYFGSRLVKNLREEHGYTYGVFSAMVGLQDAGYLAIATEVATEATADAIAQIRHEVGRLRTELVPAEELEMVKNIMTGEVMRILDGPIGIADVTIENTSNNTDNHYNALWQSQIRAMTPLLLQQLAIQYLDPARLVTVVVGKPELEGELKTPR